MISQWAMHGVPGIPERARKGRMRTRSRGMVAHGHACVSAEERAIRSVAVIAVLVAALAGAPLDGGGQKPCDLCEREETALDLVFSKAQAESMGSLYATRNEQALRQAGLASGLGEGVEPTEEARKRACLLFQLRAWDGIRLVAELASFSPGYVRVGADDPLEPLRERYENVAVYPMRFIHKAILGSGAFCLEYDIPSRYDERIRIGGLTLASGVRDVRVAGAQVRVLAREYPLADGDKVEMLFEWKVCGKAAIVRIEDRGDSLELVTVHDLQGMYVRKAGVHRLGALAVWRSISRDPSDGARVGACAYFPRLTFSLPLFLPDLGLDDLRDFGYPQPVIPRAWLLYPQRYLPRWLWPASGVSFGCWRSLGPRPQILNELFPDL